MSHLLSLWLGVPSASVCYKGDDLPWHRLMLLMANLDQFSVSNNKCIIFPWLGRVHPTNELDLQLLYFCRGHSLRACANREHIRMQYGHGCLIIRGVSEASRVEGANPCPPSNHTSSNPFGNSLLPSCQSERPIIRLAAIDLASQTG